MTTPENLGPDKRTRLTIFAVGLSGYAIDSDPSNDIQVDGRVTQNFAESVVAEARTPDGRVFTVPVEFAGGQNGAPGLDQVIIVLPPELQGVGTVSFSLIVNGRRSNSPTISIR